MNQQQIGKVLFWVGAVCVFVFSILLWAGNPVHRANTPAELQNTTWAANGFLFILRGQLGIIGAFLALIGALLYSGKKKSFFWLWGFVPVIVFGLLFFWRPSQYNPVLFGLGGGIIVLSYLGVLWTWIKTQSAYEGPAKTGRHIQLLGYSFLFFAGLLLCLYIGQPNLPGLADQPLPSSESLLVTFCLGWLFLFIGNNLEGKKRIEEYFQVLEQISGRVPVKLLDDELNALFIFFL